MPAEENCRQSAQVGDLSGEAPSVRDQMPVTRGEQSYEQVANVEFALEKSRARAKRAAENLRELGADPHLIEALEHTQEELSAAARSLRQRTYFAVADSQTSFEAA